ncbi:MAG: DNA repair protein RecN [Pseudomonadota bacterium]
MLVGLSIRNVVLIEKMDLELSGGLCALTGETGAGKSILLDSLGLALGARSDSRLLRPGSRQASVTATFELSDQHPANILLREQGLEGEDEQLFLRRNLGEDGRSRAFVNDQPVSASLLRTLGDLMIEVQGQFEQRGLLDSSTHRTLLDAHAKHDGKLQQLSTLWHAWREAAEKNEAAIQALAKSQQEEAFLRHAVEELESFDPKANEENLLADQRNRLMHREKLIETMNAALVYLGGDSQNTGADDAVGSALKLLDQIADRGGERLTDIQDCLGRATAELEEASIRLGDFADELSQEDGDLQSIEDRYFGLLDLARKHNRTAAELPELLSAFKTQLAAIDAGEDHLAALALAAEEAKQAYQKAAQDLSKSRQTAARRLDKAVKKELAPLKLEKAKFQTQVSALAEDRWGENGMDRILFEVSTNPGAPPGPLSKVASGGELSRFLLALKVVLAEVQPDQTLIFDEVDSGVGGATAQAVGQRLCKLAQTRQILVVTHSPQVAAQADHHLQVSKKAAAKKTATEVRSLGTKDRQEEIARMLSGAEITAEARAAAARLMGAA